MAPPCCKIVSLALNQATAARRCLPLGDDADMWQWPQVDPVVSAAVHNVAALFAKARQDFSGYYRAALQYLCYVSVQDLPQDEQVALARDISLAALLGDSIFSFAELLLHPVVRLAQLCPIRLCLCPGSAHQ